MRPSDFTKEKIKLLWESWKAAGGTQVTLAKASGSTQTNISLWVHGRVPGVDGLFALARGFDVPVSTFFPPESPVIAVQASASSLLFDDVVARLRDLSDDELKTVLNFITSVVIEGREPAPAARKKLGQK